MQPAYDARRDWADRRTTGDRVAVFVEGDLIRCPALRTLRDGLEVVCGHGRDKVGAGTTVTVRADRRMVDRQTGALNRICETCKAKLRIEVEFATVAAREAA